MYGVVLGPSRPSLSPLRQLFVSAISLSRPTPRRPHTLCPPPTNMLGSPLPILCGSVPIVLAAHPFSLASLPAARGWRKLHLERHLRPLAGVVHHSQHRPAPNRQTCIAHSATPTLGP